MSNAFTIKDKVLLENYQLQCRIRILEKLLAQKGTREEQMLNEGRCQTILNSQSAPVICMEPKGHITMVNDFFVGFFAQPEEELMGTLFWNFIWEEDRPGFVNILHQLEPENDKAVFIGRAMASDGTAVWYEWSIRAIFDRWGSVAEYQTIGRDITARMQMEKAYLQSQANYRTIFETTGTAMMIYGNDMKILLVNSEFEKLSGYCRSEIEHKMYWSDFIHLGDLTRMLRYHALRQADPTKAPPHYEFRLRDRCNNVKNIFLTVAPIPENQTVVVSFMDITQRKMTELALKKSEERFGAILAACPNNLVISNLSEGRFMHVNDCFCCSMGWHKTEVIGRTSAELNIWVNPLERVELVELLRRDGQVRNREYNARAKSGKVLTTLMSAEALELDGEPCMVLMMNDITERKQMEKEIARLDQLNLVGEIAASIGHEVRNPMTSIRGFLQLLKGERDFLLYGEYFDLMIEEVDRANHIITEFLNLARHKNVDLKRHSLNGLIAKLTPLIEADALVQDISLAMNLEDIPDVWLDEKEIRQMIFNLVRNGLEAMTPGGKLTLSTHLEGRQVVLMVGDEGSGIEPEVLEKIGVPFFTTKESGSGLGLSVCYSIAARHNAAIQVDSSNQGTRFFIGFPVPDDQTEIQYDCLQII